MWPWQTSSTGFQVPHTPPTHYVTSQPPGSIPLSSYPLHAAAVAHGNGSGEYMHSHSGMGIGYGIAAGSPNMYQPVVPESATPTGGVVYQQHPGPEDMGGVVHRPQPTPLSPTVHGPPNTSQTPSMQETPLAGPLMSPQLQAGGGAYLQQAPPSVVTSPPPTTQQGYLPGVQQQQHQQHTVAHGSSPFSMDFILSREERAPEVTGGVAAVVPSYVAGGSQSDIGE